LDHGFASRGTRRSEAQKRVILVGLDEPSLDAPGKPLAEASPELADVVRHLDRGGVAAVGIDPMAPEVLARRPEAHAGDLGAAAATGEVVLPAMDLGDCLLRPPATRLVPRRRGVVCSLWQVDDAPTAELMADLNAGLKRGEPVVGALRAAQLARIESGEPPRRRAPFVLIGRSRCASLAHAISSRVA
jgi:hypothetical protein